MSKYLTFLLLFSLVANNVFCLRCYATDPTRNDSNSLPMIKTCKDELKITDEVDFRCVVVILDSDDATINFQSCLGPLDTCDSLKRLVLQNFYNLTGVECYICQSDLCNSGLIHDWRRFSCFILFAAVASIIIFSIIKGIVRKNRKAVVFVQMKNPQEV